jgi:hypothetical protein
MKWKKRDTYPPSNIIATTSLARLCGGAESIFDEAPRYNLLDFANGDNVADVLRNNNEADQLFSVVV